MARPGRLSGPREGDRRTRVPLQIVPPAAPTDEPFTLDLPESDELQLRARAQLRSLQRQHTTQYRDDPYRFLTECVWTLDQATSQVRRFPTYDDPAQGCECMPGGCANYVQHVTNRWLQNKRYLVPKSRRVLVSWTMVALHCWLARFYPGSTIAFVSRKQGLNDSEGAAELVRRVKFIEEHLPMEIEPLPFQYNFARIKYPSINSEIIGVAQGADQLRQYTLTAIFADEMAFWELAHDTYSASMPTLEGGGRFTGVSSANPGFFKQAVFDSL
jgi:hypothetical protein